MTADEARERIKQRTEDSIEILKDAADEPGLPNPYVRKPSSEGKPWSDPESDPLADLRDAAERARGGEAPTPTQGFA